MRISCDSAKNLMSQLPALVAFEGFQRASQAGQNAPAGSTQPPQAAALFEALGFILVLTALISLIEIPSKSKAGWRASCGNGYFWMYFGILAIGNAVAGLLSFVFVSLPPSLNPFAPFLHAFVGVFAFQGIMSNTNLTFLDKGVLTIDDWISKARETAVAEATQRQVRAEQSARRRTAEILAKMDEEKLDVYIDNHLGREVFETIAAAARKHGDSAKLYKALEFAKRDPENAAAIAGSLRTS